MPRNLVRYQQTGSDLHFITFSCYRRQPYLGTPEARELFEKSLEAMRLRYDFWITGSSAEQGFAGAKAVRRSAAQGAAILAGCGAPSGSFLSKR
jgi:hypothetical protein